MTCTNFFHVVVWGSKRLCFEVWSDHFSVIRAENAAQEYRKRASVIEMGWEVEVIDTATLEHLKSIA